LENTEETAESKRSQRKKKKAAALPGQAEGKAVASEARDFKGA
jgi:hypothetical protein